MHSSKVMHFYKILSGFGLAQERETKGDMQQHLHSLEKMSVAPPTPSFHLVFEGGEEEEGHAISQKMQVQKCKKNHHFFGHNPYVHQNSLPVGEGTIYSSRELIFKKKCLAFPELSSIFFLVPEDWSEILM